MAQQSNALLDSILHTIQNKPITKNEIERSINLPYDVIVNNLNKSLIIFEKLNESKLETDPVKLGDLKEKLALVYYLKGNYVSSSDLHKQSIALFQKANEQRKKANALAAMAYESKKRNLKLSIDWMREAKAALMLLNEKRDLSSVTNNFGVLFEMNNQLDSALFYYNEALQLNIITNDSVGMPYTLNNIAGIYFMKKNYEEGIKYMDRSTEIRNRKNDKLGIAWNEFSIGEFFAKENKDNDALFHFRRSLSYANIADFPDLKGRNYKFLANILAKQNRFDSAYHYFNSFFTIHDSLFNDQNQKQLVEMESIYENEKKSSQIKDLNAQNQLKENELEKKRFIQLFLSLIVLSIGIFTFFLLKAYREKKKANEIIVKQKIEVEEQKHIIEEKQKEIIDSINYAKRIQSAYLPPEETFHHVLQNAFLLFKPKDIVSGDFYWFFGIPKPNKTGTTILCAVADCTGHGVPGALMSVICCNALNDVVISQKINNTDQILNETRKLVKRSLKSTSYNGQKDGMDIALIKLDTETGDLWYSGAYNPAWIIKDKQLLELSADKQPIGVFENEKAFSVQHLQLNKGDSIYLFSDGYADQFGGPKGKKFKYKTLGETILKQQTKPMNEQRQLLLDTFNDWKGDLEQVDDVCIIGIRI
ncbi:MAG: SpoIIE family protein phosphatase [Sphingobacteriaceae bacterium]